jgi:hypothetical protein
MGLCGILVQIKLSRKKIDQNTPIFYASYSLSPYSLSNIWLRTLHMQVVRYTMKNKHFFMSFFLFWLLFFSREGSDTDKEFEFIRSKSLGSAIILDHKKSILIVKQ